MVFLVVTAALFGALVYMLGLCFLNRRRMRRLWRMLERGHDDGEEAAREDRRA